MVLLASACGAADEAPAGEPASLQAVLSIERVEDASHEETPSASAMAEFVILPAELDARETLDAAGLRTSLPERPGCVEVSLGEGVTRDAAVRALRDRTNALQRTATVQRRGVPAQLELLDAGEVNIRADGMVTRLALNLFPASGSAGGVIYTTPDQSAEPLPAGTNYAISASGSGFVPRLDIRGNAPAALRDVTLGGAPLDRAATFTSAQPLDFTWAEGEASDRVYVELARGQTEVLCTFADEDGSGSVPSALTAKFPSDADVRISVHRVREAVRSRDPQHQSTLITDPAVPEQLLLDTTVRFDFELTSQLHVE